MLEHLISVEAVCALWVVSVGCWFGPRPRRPRLHIRDNFAANQVRCHKRVKRQLERCGKASWVRNADGLTDPVPIDLSQSIYEPPLAIHTAILTPVLHPKPNTLPTHHIPSA